MAEGDTIFRAARTLRAALRDATVLQVRTSVPALQAVGPERLVGQRVAEVESRGKHLLVHFAPSGLVLHTHLGMHGSWHLYGEGDRWHKPADRARVVLDVRSQQRWLAACFDPQVASLSAAERVRERLAGLGPDLLATDVDLDEAARRLLQDPEREVADALLDQHVVAGIGNVYKSEILFLCGVHPWARAGTLGREAAERLLDTARRLLARNVAPGASGRVTTTGPVAAGAARYYVYGRARRPCLRCSTPISVRRQGEHARLTYWCARCQPGGGDQ